MTISAAVLFFRALPLVWKIVGPLVIVGVLWGGFELYKASLRNEGARRAIEQIETQDRKASDAADEGDDRVTACWQSGGVWRSSTRECERG